MSQTEKNPFKYSDTNKRYYTYDYYLKRTFGKKCAKITLDLGFSCPNIDGTRGVGGCIYCSGGSGARHIDRLKSVREQYHNGVMLAKKKWDVDSFVPYLQAYTNSHTSPDNFEKILNEVSLLEGAVMIDIATRADCLENEKIEILGRLSEKIPITVELGLQTSSDEVARLINRCHTYSEFTDCVNRLRALAPRVKIGVVESVFVHELETLFSSFTDHFPVASAPPGGPGDPMGELEVVGGCCLISQLERQHFQVQLCFADDFAAAVNGEGRIVIPGRSAFGDMDVESEHAGSPLFCKEPFVFLKHIACGVQPPEGVNSSLCAFAAPFLVAFTPQIGVLFDGDGVFTALEIADLNEEFFQITQGQNAETHHFLFALSGKCPDLAGHFVGFGAAPGVDLVKTAFLEKKHILFAIEGRHGLVGHGFPGIAFGELGTAFGFDPGADLLQTGF